MNLLFVSIFALVILAGNALASDFCGPSSPKHPESPKGANGPEKPPHRNISRII
jgi:hypothetical protein